MRNLIQPVPESQTGLTDQYVSDETMRGMSGRLRFTAAPHQPPLVAIPIFKGIVTHVFKPFFLNEIFL